MKTRIITATVGLVVFIPCLIFSNTFLFEIFLALASEVAVFELIRCAGQGRNVKLMIPSLLLALISPFVIRQININIAFVTYLSIIAVFYALYVLALSTFSHGKLPVTDAGLIITMVLYIIVGFCGMLKIRAMTGGEYVFLIIFISSWLPDAGAYFVGVKFGRHKLIPDVSPKKTVEGAVGGIITCIAAFIIYAVIINIAFDVSLNVWLMILASIVLTVVSMLGDLIASLIKRHYKIKDYGKLLPGHGGILDRFDSALATSMVLYALFLIPAFADNILKINF